MPFSIIIKEVPVMGVFSEINLMMREQSETVQPFTLEAQPEPTQESGTLPETAEEAKAREQLQEAAAAQNLPDTQQPNETPEPKQDDEQQKRMAAEQAERERIANMTDEEVVAASMSRTADDTERLTRRNMKLCVLEVIQTKCLEDPAFARLVLQPRKSMRNCFHHINRQARDYLRREMEDNDEKAVDGVYGGDVPDELCYQWAEEYFRDPDAEVDRPKEAARAKPVAKTEAKTRKKRELQKATPKKPAEESQTMEGQITFGDLAGGKAVA